MLDHVQESAAQTAQKFGINYAPIIVPRSLQEGSIEGEKWSLSKKWAWPSTIHYLVK